jgi:hypothetical protein
VLGAGEKPALHVQNPMFGLLAVIVFESDGHPVHTASPAAAYVATGHVLQVEIAVAATVAEAFPAKHAMHVLVPFSALNLPAEQATQTSEADSK